MTVPVPSRGRGHAPRGSGRRPACRSAAAPPSLSGSKRRAAAAASAASPRARAYCPVETRLVWPACQNTSAGWPRLAEAGGRPELALRMAGRAGGPMGRSLWAAISHIARLLR
eukprot:scaffold115704_cov75-Phaeocystis_antarctica.AAC.3